MSSDASVRSCLVVDDDEFQLELICDMLRRLGVESVRQAHDGAEALRQLDATGQAFDLLVSDLQMPGMDGIELLRSLSNRGYRGAVVLLSGQDPRILETAQRLAAAHGLNLVGALQKPVAEDTLRDLLSRARQGPGKPNGDTAEVTPEELSRALGSGEILLHFQPKVALAGDAPPPRLANAWCAGSTRSTASFRP